MSRICFYLNLLCSGGNYSCHVSAVFDVYRIKCVGGSIFNVFFSRPNEDGTRAPFMFGNIPMYVTQR